ncbi:MFS transporter [Haloarchaeobius sp. TZWWS8]|uniref:MFS transporter n=1 Tax=Haloarchaeobius sp. TZWWS8 TaxID=3446121 RepID=UPI003EB8360E
MRALFRNPDFVRLFAGRVVTNVGDSLYFVAAMWLVYDLTGSATYSGIAGFLVMAPAALQAFFGPLVDRWNLRRIMVGTQLVQGVVILSLPVAAHFGYLSVWLVLTVMPLLSLLNQLVYPAHSALVPRIVEDDELVSANSLFALAYQGVDSVANAAGGVLIALVGATTLFLVDSVTFAAAALLFATVRVPEAEPNRAASPSESADSVAVADGGVADEAVDDDNSGDGGVDDDNSGDGSADDDSSYLTDLREGVDFVRGTVLVPILLGSALVNVAAGGAIFASMPAFADTFGGPRAYGTMMAAFGVGSFLGALVASRVDDRPFGLLSIACFASSGVVWIGSILLAMLTGDLLLTASVFALSVVPIGVSNVLLGAMTQSIVPEALMGRVSSVLGSAATASIPVGALFGGALTDALGPYPIFLATGGGLLLLAGYWLTDSRLRSLGAVESAETLSAA